MSTVKITDLAAKTLAPNTANTIFVGVDLPTGVTGKYTAKDLVDNLYANDPLPIGNTIIFADSTTQNTSFAAAASYANSAFLKANAAFLVANTPDAIANSAALYANGAFIQSNAAFLVANTPTHVANSAALYANGAFAKANAALANTTGTFAGDLTITGNTQTQTINTGNLTVVGTSAVSGNANFAGIVSMTGAVNMNATLVLANSNFSATEAAFRITASGNSQTPTQAGTLMQLTNKPNVPARVLIDSFGTSNTAYSIIAGRAARGTVDAPAPTQNNDILLRIAGNSYGNTGYAPFGDARIDFVASEDHSDTARGSRIRFWNTPNGSNVVNEIASFNADSVYFTGVVSPEKGFVYTPRQLGAQTAITINFATDSMIRATYSSTLTISFSNYTYGKVVEVWLTNTAGTGQTINLGILANNSTTGSATLSVASNRSAKLQYFSIDGDLANTFCAITYA
jgi:hypothetical protein